MSNEDKQICFCCGSTDNASKLCPECAADIDAFNKTAEPFPTESIGLTELLDRLEAESIMPIQDERGWKAPDLINGEIAPIFKRELMKRLDVWSNSMDAAFDLRRAECTHDHDTLCEHKIADAVRKLEQTEIILSADISQLGDTTSFKMVRPYIEEQHLFISDFEGLKLWLDKNAQEPIPSYDMVDAAALSFMQIKRPSLRELEAAQRVANAKQQDQEYRRVLAQRQEAERNAAIYGWLVVILIWSWIILMEVYR